MTTTGWDDYADGWRVETPDGEILGTRVPASPACGRTALHPVPRRSVDAGGVSEIVVRSRTNVTGWADDASFPVPVPWGG